MALKKLAPILPPAMTTAQRNAIPTGVGRQQAGALIFNTDTNRHEHNVGTDAAPVWTSGGIPVGGVIDFPWAAGSIPAYTALPVGQNLARASFPDLATLDTASGTPHGTSAGNIVMPDYRSRVGVGMDNMGGVAALRVTVAVSGADGTVLGGVVGLEGVTLTSGMVPAHTHTVPDHTHSISIIGANPNMGCPTAPQPPSATNGVNSNLGGAALTTSSFGSGGAHTSMQPGLFVNKIMRVL